MIRAKRTTALLVGASLAAALSLGACGGSGDGSADSTRARKPSDTVPHEAVPPTAVTAPDHKQAGSGSGGEGDRPPPGTHPDRAPSSPPQGQAENRTPAPDPAAAAGDCPARLSRQQCDEIAGAVARGQQRGTTPGPAGKCPSSLSPEQCAGLVEGSGGGSSGQPLPFEECPAGLPESRCRELEEAVSR